MNYFHLPQSQFGDISSCQRSPLTLHKVLAEAMSPGVPQEQLRDSPAQETGSCPRQPTAGNKSVPHSPSALLVKGPKTGLKPRIHQPLCVFPWKVPLFQFHY